MKTILVPFGGSEDGAAALEAAFAIAHRFNAHVSVLHVRPDPGEALHMTSMAFPGALRRSVLEVGERHAAEAAEAARAIFDDYCAKHKIQVVQAPPAPAGVSVAWREQVGKESLVVARLGRLCDLVVMERAEENSPARETLEAALLDTGRPVLILPPDPPDTIGSKVALGWNGSVVAANAVVAARHFMASAERVVVLTAPDGAMASARDLVEELAWHGITAEAHHFESGSRRIGVALLDEAKALGMNLLVLGGYGTSRARSMILGSITRYMLAESDLPVLMVH
jgi:nucleotide-binding universal stress UspA family protein